MIILKMDPELNDLLTREADKQRRSKPNQILHILEASLKNNDINNAKANFTRTQGDPYENI